MKLIFEEISCLGVDPVSVNRKDKNDVSYRSWELLAGKKAHKNWKIYYSPQPEKSLCGCTKQGFEFLKRHCDGNSPKSFCTDFDRIGIMEELCLNCRDDFPGDPL